MVWNTLLCVHAPHPPRPVPASTKHPLRKPGSSPGLARETSWAPMGLGRGACHTHTHRARVAACKRRCKRLGSQLRCQPHPHPTCHRAPPPRNCSNRPWLPPGCYSSGRARAELQGGRGEACWAGGQPEGHLVTGRQHRFSPIWTPDLGTPPGALQGGPIPVPGAPMKSVGPGCPGRACIPSCFVKGRADET